MKKISLTEVEVNDLLDLYQSEIDRAQRRINNLKTIVKKITEGQSIESLEEAPVKVASKQEKKSKAKSVEAKVEKNITAEPKKRGRKPKAKVEEVKAEPKKRGRKPKVKIEEAKEVAKKPAVEKSIKKVKKEKVAQVKAEPKKRGRKPKALTATTIENNEVKVADKAKKTKSKTAKKVKKVKSEPKKRGRKPKSLRKPIKSGKGKDKVKWNAFINETISSKDSLMLASSITQAALEKFEIPASDRDRVRMAISTTLTKMANKDKVLRTYSQEGIRGAFFGLAQWFNDNGELNNDYKKKLM